MSNQGNNDVPKLIAGILVGILEQNSQIEEKRRETERKIAIRKAQIRAEAEHKLLIDRKNNLANKLTLIIEKLNNPRDKEMAQSKLDQLLNSDLSLIPSFERMVDSAYPEFSNIYQPIIIARQPINQPPIVYRAQPIEDLFNLLSIQPSERQISRSVPIPEVKEDEKKINISHFSELERLADDIKSGSLTCAICLEKFAKNDKDVEIRRCLHTFHKKCLSQWENTGRTNGKTCPCCRQ